MVKKIDEMNCKIIALKVKKNVFFRFAKEGQQTLNLLSSKLLHYTKLRLSKLYLKIMLQIHKKKIIFLNSKKTLSSFYKGSSNRRMYL
jgi:hypothetical protein